MTETVVVYRANIQVLSRWICDFRIHPGQSNSSWSTSIPKDCRTPSTNDGRNGKKFIERLARSAANEPEEPLLALYSQCDVVKPRTSSLQVREKSAAWSNQLAKLFSNRQQ